MKLNKSIGLLALTILLLTGCDNVNKLIKSNDSEAKYQAAVKYYDNGQYSQAIQLFENLFVQYHGKEHAEDIAWRYATALMNTKDYYTAGYQFRNFYKRYAYSDKAEEALFLSAMCKYYESPEYNLDQQQTKEAIAAFESYVDRYPQSTHVPEINQYLDELRYKLMRKDYEIAYNYYETEQYNAAYVSLGRFLNEYPDSPYKEKAMFYMLSSSYEYGINSTEEKQRERLQQVINDFERFATSFQDSKFLGEAQKIYTKTRAALAKYEQQSNQTIKQ